MTYDLEPSEVYRQCKAKVEALRSQLNAMIPICDATRDEFMRIFHELNAAEGALRETPEQKYLSELSDTEFQADRALLEIESGRRDRLVTMLSFDRPGPDEEYASIEEAIDDAGFSDNAGERPPTPELVVVLADMRVLTPAQLVRVLRRMVAKIEQDGILVYRDLSPLTPNGSEWWLSVTPSGELRHNFYRQEQLR